MDMKYDCLIEEIEAELEKSKAIVEEKKGLKNRI